MRRLKQHILFNWCFHKHLLEICQWYYLCNLLLLLFFKWQWKDCAVYTISCFSLFLMYFFSVSVLYHIRISCPYSCFLAFLYLIVDNGVCLYVCILLYFLFCCETAWLSWRGEGAKPIYWVYEGSCLLSSFVHVKSKGYKKIVV